MSLIDRLLLVGYWFEALYVRIRLLFGLKKNTNPIPKGPYCYEYTGYRWLRVDGRAIRETRCCPYFRSTKLTGGIACTYLGVYGFDICLYDQCKICGENEE